MINHRRASVSRRTNPLRPAVLGLENRRLLNATSTTDVISYHNDESLSGDNLAETTLTPANVNPTDFGKLFSQPVDGQVYAEPLVKTQVLINGVYHSVVYVATENDTVYAFDARNNQGADAAPLWSRSFIDPAAGITTVPAGDVLTTDINPVIGITGTPVIDAATNTLYVVAATKEIRGGVAHYVQTLYGLDLATGAETIPGGYVIGDTAPNASNPGTFTNITAISSPGTGDGNVNGIVSFNALTENQRPALIVDGSNVLVSWASHGDNGPYFGWLAAFDIHTLQLTGVFNTSPDGSESGIWQSGDPPAIDPNTGDIIFSTGNGTVDPLGTSPREDYGESVVSLDPTPTNDMYTVSDFFTPYEYQALNDQDADFGSGGNMLLPASVGSAAHPNLLVAAGKEGKIYLIDRDAMGELSNPAVGPDDVVQEINTNNPGIYGSPTFLQVNATTGIIYYHSVANVLTGYYISDGHIEDGSLPTDHPVLRGAYNSGYPGAEPVISADGTQSPTSPANAIVWEIETDGYGSGGPGILRAYDAMSLNEIYDSSMTGSRDTPDRAVKFSVPTVVNGLVYVGSSDSISVFGEFPTSTTVPASPTSLSANASPTNGTAILLNWVDPSPAAGASATAIEVLRSTDGVNFTNIATLPASTTEYTDPGPLSLGANYTYEVVASNQVGSSSPSQPSNATTQINSSVLTLTNATSSTISLSWTPEGNGNYAILRSTDGLNFTPIASVPFGETTYTDTGLSAGIYSYEIEAFNVDPVSNSYSNVEGATIGGLIDLGNGFTNTSSLTSNGSATFADQVARITDSNLATGSIFTDNRITIGSFSTSFTIRFHEGTQPEYADGIAFVIQTESPTALGLGGSGLGYQGIGGSIAIKLNTFQSPGDPSATTTGLYENGAAPIAGIDTSNGGSGLKLNSQDPKLVTLTYDGTTLTETITDTLDPSDTFSTSYTVNIPAAIGSDTAYVGFTGSTGDGNNWQLEDVTNWNFASNEALPGAPNNLAVTGTTANSVTLSWQANSFNETGYQVERSSDGVNYAVIGTTSATSFSDVGVAPGAYLYQVVAFNSSGNSPASNSVKVNAGLEVNQSDGFADGGGDLAFDGSGGFSFNGNAKVSGSVAKLLDGGGLEAGSFFTNTRLPIDQFSTSFEFQFAPGSNPIADGMTFTIQDDPNGPNALGGFGGELGYGSFNGGPSISNSVAIMFDAYNGSYGATGLWTDGNLVETDYLPGGGLCFNQGAFNNPPDTYDVTLTYDGTTLTETIDDLNSGASFSASYSINLASVIGSSTAYVGFTGADGGYTSVQQVDSWTWEAAPPNPVTHLVLTTTPSAVAGSTVTLTVAAEDASNQIVPDFQGTIQFSGTDPSDALPANYTFVPGDDGIRSFQLPLNTVGTWSLTATEQGSTIAGITSIVVNPSALSFTDISSQYTNYGTSTLTISGDLGSDFATPSGLEFSVTINSVTEEATTFAGQFSVSFETSNWGVASSPYAIVYDFAGTSQYLAATDTSTRLTISPASLIVTASARSKTYGTVLSLATTAFSAVGLKNGETIGQVALTSDGSGASANVTVTPYALTPAGATGGTFNPANYAISYVAGLLTVTKAHLSVQAVLGASDVGHGSSLPSVTFTYSGFANGDTAAVLSGNPVASGLPTTSSPAGLYTITPNVAGESAQNYDFTTFVPATLSIHPVITNILVMWGTQTMSVLNFSRDLPFFNITGFEVVFSDPVDINGAGISLTSTAGGPGYSPTLNGSRNDVRQATWTLPTAIGIDRLMLALDQSNIWADGNSSLNLIGTTSQQISVLPGDFNGDGIVSSGDLTGLLNATSLPYNPLADLNGAGTVTQADYTLARPKVGTKLPPSH